MNPRIVLAGCLALIIAIGLRTWVPVERVTLPDIPEPDTRFDYTLTDFSATFRDEHDQLELLISGPRLEHETDQRVGRLIEPRFHIDPQGADWRGQARRGLILREEDAIVLQEEVRLTHAHPEGDIQIIAESLHHYRARRTITSDKPVEIHQAGSWLRAGGIIIYLDDNTIELTDHVQGTLKPAVRQNAGAGAADGS